MRVFRPLTGASHPYNSVVVGELQAAQADLDVAAAVVRAPGIGAFLGGTMAPGSASDRLRLPEPSRLPGNEIRASLRRVLSVEIRPVAAPEEAVVKEAKMRRVLTALDGVHDWIQARAQEREV